MSDLKTMFQLSGRVHAHANLSNATLIIIDAQKEYLSGPLALTGVNDARQYRSAGGQSACGQMPDRSCPSSGHRGRPV